MRIDKPCTILVKSFSPCIEICRGKNDLFYLHKNAANFQKVNIPIPGQYFFKNCAPIASETRPLQKVPFNISLPKFERNFDAPIIIDKNIYDFPGPARIYAKFGVIQKSKMFEKLPGFCKLFILLHECAHQKYKTEEFCDLWAMKEYFEMGYNPSQAFFALSNVLRPGQANEKRIFELFKKLQLNENVR